MSLRRALERGSSQELAYLKKHSEIYFQFLRQCGVEIRHVDTSENIADGCLRIGAVQQLSTLQLQTRTMLRWRE